MANLNQENAIANYAQQQSPLQHILTSMQAANKSPEDTSLEDLEGALEFHYGGADSTKALFEVMGMSAGDHVLDIGCGLGGPAMLCARDYGCKVTGIDLTPSFIEAASTIKTWPLINVSVDFLVGDVTAMTTVSDSSIDKALMIHVGMNLPQEIRKGLAKELLRVLKPGGKFGIFDPMIPKAGGTIDYPLPFATTADDCDLIDIEAYKSIFSDFDILGEKNDSPGVVGMLYGAAGSWWSPPVVTLESVMGPTWEARRNNCGKALMSGDLLLQTLVVQKKGPNQTYSNMAHKGLGPWAPRPANRPRKDLPTLAVVGGTGRMGVHLCAAWANAGYEVTMCSRQKEKAHDIVTELLAGRGYQKIVEGQLAGQGDYCVPPCSADGWKLKAGDNSAAAAADLIVLATMYEQTWPILETIALEIRGKGKIILDMTNPFLTRPDGYGTGLPEDGPQAGILVHKQKLDDDSVKWVGAYKHILWTLILPSGPANPDRPDIEVFGDAEAVQVVVEMIYRHGWRPIVRGGLDAAPHYEGGVVSASKVAGNLWGEMISGEKLSVGW